MRLDDGLRRFGESREFIDHAANVTDLADDRFGALLEDFAIAGKRLAVFPAQPLGRELNWRQRILDLMRDTARDIRPGRSALRAGKLGNVVERNDITVLRVGRGLRRHAHVDGAVTPAA